jgi:hypothetical protein
MKIAVVSLLMLLSSVAYADLYDLFNQLVSNCNIDLVGPQNPLIAQVLMLEEKARLVTDGRPGYLLVLSETQTETGYRIIGKPLPVTTLNDLTTGGNIEINPTHLIAYDFTNEDYETFGQHVTDLGSTQVRIYKENHLVGPEFSLLQTGLNTILRINGELYVVASMNRVEGPLLNNPNIAIEYSLKLYLLDSEMISEGSIRLEHSAVLVHQKKANTVEALAMHTEPKLDGMPTGPIEFVGKGDITRVKGVPVSVDRFQPDPNYVRRRITAGHFSHGRD